LTRFDRYVLRRFFSAALLLVGLLVVFFVVLDYVEYVDDFMDRGATMREVFGSYYRHYVPEIVRLVSPLAVFLAAIYTTARLSQSMQLVALTSAGVSLWRVLVPFALAGAAVTGFMLWFNGFVVPPSNAVVLDFQRRYYREAPDEVEAAGLYRQLAPGAVLRVGFFDAEEQRALDVELLRFEEAPRTSPTGQRVRVPVRLAERVAASDMTWADSTGRWTLENASRRTFTPDGREVVAPPATLDTALALGPRDLARGDRDAERLTLPEARAYVAALRRAGVSRLGRPLVEMHEKVAYPFANLVLVLIGVPLAARRRRGGQAAQFGLGLLLAFAYLAAERVLAPFGYAEAIDPAFAAWAPHAAFFLLALVLLARAPK
jgi:lipopolysaccharide export system permease protein